MRQVAAISISASNCFDPLQSLPAHTSRHSGPWCAGRPSQSCAEVGAKSRSILASSI